MFESLASNLKVSIDVGVKQTFPAGYVGFDPKKY